MPKIVTTIIGMTSKFRIYCSNFFQIYKYIYQLPRIASRGALTNTKRS